MKLYIFYNLHHFLNILDDDKIANFEQYNIIKHKNKHLFTFCDLHYAFSKKIYKVQNDSYKFADFIKQQTYDLKRIKQIKNPAKLLKKQVLLKMYKIAKKSAHKAKIRVCFMTYQEYSEIADKFFTTNELINKKIIIKY